MSSTTTTQFYGLTQYIGTDKPDFADNNTAFRNVDADLHQVVQDSQGFTSDIADLTERVGNLDTDLTNLSGDLDGEKAKITALQNKELSQDTEISRVERNAQDMITAYNEASATSTHAYAVGDYFIYNNVLYQATAAIAVGATIVPDTNCTTTNVTSELIQLNNDLADKTAPVVISPTWISGLNISNGEAYRVGNILILNFQLSQLSIVGGETVLGQLPVTLPAIQIFNYNTYSGKLGEFIISTTGEMKIEHAEGFNNDIAYINCACVID